MCRDAPNVQSTFGGIACRLSKHCFVRVYLFPTEEMEPEHLTADEVREILGGVQ